MASNSITFDVEPVGFMGRNFSKHFVNSFSTMAHYDIFLPTIKCNKCNGIFYMYRWSDKKNDFYNYSASNILKHAKCADVDQLFQPKLKSIVPAKLPSKVRTEFCSLAADLVSMYPTISIQSGVDFLNQVATRASQISIQANQAFNFDISRQLVSKTILSKGQDQGELNCQFFKENISKSCLIIDHWSKGGTNYFGIIARTITKQYYVCEYLLHFKVADDDKTGDGIYNQLSKLLPENDIAIPVVSDNCPSMVAALSGYKNKTPRARVYKIFCIEHFLAKIDESIHKICNIKKLDKMISSIDSYFNYRSEK